MNKLSVLLQLFRKGAVVSDPVAWKQRQITATVLGAFILALINVLAAFGYALPIDTETANAIAGGIIAIVNVLLTVTTTDKVGLPAKSNEVLTDDSIAKGDDSAKNEPNPNDAKSNEVPTKQPTENIYLN